MKDRKLVYRCLDCDFETEVEDDSEEHQVSMGHEIESMLVEFEVPEKETLSKIDDTEEEPLEEDLTEKGELTKEETEEALRNFDRLPESQRSFAIAEGLDNTQAEDQEPIHTTQRTDETIRKYYDKVVRQIQDPRLTSCPICHKDYREGISPEQLSILDRIVETEGDKGEHEGEETKIPEIRVLHIKQVHSEIYKLVKHLFLTTRPKEVIAPSGEGMPHQVGSPNPEACSKSSEKLSNEDKTFLEQLSKKVEEGLDLTKEERERYLRLWIQTRRK